MFKSKRVKDLERENKILREEKTELFLENMRLSKEFAEYIRQGIDENGNEAREVLERVYFLAKNVDKATELIFKNDKREYVTDYR